MKTDELIDTLASDLRPVCPARADWRMLLAALLACVAAVLLIIGPRPDLYDALRTSTPWLKGAYTLTVAVTAVWLSALLGRPGADLRPALIALLAIIGMALPLGTIDLTAVPAGGLPSEWGGQTWGNCSRDILVVSVFGAPFVFISARRFASIHPAASGATLGIAAGGFAATAYGVLRCPETSIAFVATWYTLAIAGAGAAGSLVGRFALRW